MTPTTFLLRETAPAARRWVVLTLLTLVGLALAARVVAFLTLPNIDGDAYCYLDKARELRAAILVGHLRVQDLFYFWLPLYPLAVALASLVVPGGGHLMFVGKLISAASGFAVCWLVYRIVLAMTRRPLFALAGALAVAVDPWQLLYSSNTMTELPFEALVLGALDRLIVRRWTAASLWLVFAGFVRVEAWPLAALVPCAAFLVERRVRVAPLLLTFAAPTVWLAISYAAEGDARAFFTIRNAYVAEYIAHNPAQAHLTLAGVQGDWSNLRQGACLPILLGACAAIGRLVAGFYAAEGDARAFFTIRNAYVAEYIAHNPAQAHLTLAGVQGDWSNLRQGACLPILLGACAAIGRLVVGFFQRRSEPLRGWFAAAATAVVFLFMLTFLLAAYVTHAQPVIWVRYGLIYLPLGLCLTLWWLAEGVGPRTRRVAAGLLGIGFLVHSAYEIKVVNDTRGNLLFQRQAAALLASLGPHRVFCDSIVVRVEAGLTSENSCDSSSLPQEPARFLTSLRQRGVDYLVYIDSEASTPVKSLPALAAFRPAFGLEPFQKIGSPDWRPPVLIYHVNPLSNDD